MDVGKVAYKYEWEGTRLQLVALPHPSLASLLDIIMKICSLVLVLASLAAADAVSSLSGNFQNCNIQCGNDQAPPLSSSTSSFSSSHQGSTYRRGKAGAKGERGAKGEVGPAGASCQCSRVPELEEKLEKLEILYSELDMSSNSTITQLRAIINESRVEDEKTRVGIAAMQERLDILTRAYELEQKKKFIREHKGSCQQLQELASTYEEFENLATSGVRTFNISGQQKQVYCTEDGYTVIQRRFDGSVNFERNFAEFENGFGDPRTEVWLGLRHLREMTRTGTWTLLAELQSQDGVRKSAEYSDFKVGPAPRYELTSLGAYSGDAGDSMRHNEGAAFSTKDNNQQDECRSLNCAGSHNRGSFWYNCCTDVNLNSFRFGGSSGNHAMYWYDFNNDYQALKSSTLSIKRTD